MPSRRYEVDIVQSGNLRSSEVVTVHYEDDDDFSESTLKEIAKDLAWDQADANDSWEFKNRDTDYEVYEITLTSDKE